MFRGDGLDALDRGFERQHKTPHLKDVHRWISLPPFALELDPGKLVDSIAQLRRVLPERADDARQNQRKINLRRSRQKGPSAAGFLRIRSHLAMGLPPVNPYQNH